MAKCVNCGNNPTPHFVNWLNESVSVLMMPLNQALFGGQAGKTFFKKCALLSSPVVLLLEKIKVITYGNDISDKTSSRAEVLWAEAKRRGIIMQSLRIFGKENDSYRVKINGRWIYFSGLPRPEYMPGTGEWWMDDKALVKKKLIKAGIPVPMGGSFSSYRQLKKMFDSLQKPVIIKPRLGSRGRHTTTYIYTEEQLKKAFIIAKQLCYWVVMEEHLVGSVYRGTMIDGKFTGNLRGDPPRITGDGVHTIRELITIKNMHRHPEIHDVVIKPHMEIFLARNNRTLDDVLPAGETIDLSEKIGVSYGGNSSEDTSITHPETIKILEAAAAAIGDPLIGFDFIIEYIDRPPHTQKWGIIECNGVPFINLHHDPIEGPSNNVAQWVWNFVENNSQYY
jgi:D-alanine-D-alanine ligase-like ATP-grasp enzyme